MALIYLAELTVYDPALPGTRVLTFASGRGFTTTPSETPANTFYDPRLKQALDIQRDLFARGTTQGRTRIGYGDLVLNNEDGGLDALLGYAFDGRAITVRVGDEAAAYPAGFTTVFVGTMEQCEVSVSSVIVKVRDRQLELQVPLQTTKYAGSNSLPAGLEGVATDLKGKPKPLCYGVVKKVPAICVNTSKLIYQVNDGALNGIDAVYDKGVRLGTDAPFDWSEAHATIGGYCGATDGSTIVTGGISGGNPIIHTTTNGTSYSTIGGLPFISAGCVTGMAYSPTLDRFCAVTNNATGEIATSDDAGATWTIRTAAAASSFDDVRWDAPRGLFIAVGTGGAIHTSPTGVTWTARTSGTASALETLATGGPLIVVVGASGALTTSPDGITWTATTLGTSSLRAAGYSDGAYIVVSNGTTVYRSVEARQWSIVHTLTTRHTVRALGLGGGWFVLTSVDSGTGFSALTSSQDNGRSWQAIAGSESLTNGDPAEVLLMGGRWFCLALNGTYRSGTPDTYANQTDLLDDALAPAPGMFGVYLAGGYFRLGAPPAGLVTADVTQGANAAARTAGQIYTQVLTKAGKTSPDWRASDITALDAANAAVLGLWVGLEETTAAELCDKIAASVGAWWGSSVSGIYRIKQLIDPAAGSSVASLTANDLLKPLDRVATNDTGRGLPTYRTILRYGRFYVVQTTDLAGGVSSDVRQELAREWREVVSTDAAVQTAHLLAGEYTVETLLTSASDAATEAARVQTLRGVRRELFEVQPELNAGTLVIDLGDVVTLQHPRYGLSAGRKLLVAGVSPDAAARRVTLTLWG